MPEGDGAASLLGPRTINSWDMLANLFNTVQYPADAVSASFTALGDGTIGAVEEDLEGDAASSLVAFAAAGDATVANLASGTPALVAAVPAATGELGLAGSGTPTLAPSTAAGDATLANLGSGTPLLVALDGASASSTLSNLGSGEPGLVAFAPAATGELAITGSGSASLIPTSVGDGGLSNTGQGAPTHQALVGAGTGGVVDDNLSGAGTGVTGAATALGSLSLRLELTGAAGLPVCTASAEGAQANAATCAGGLAALTATGSATVGAVVIGVEQVVVPLTLRETRATVALAVNTRQTVQLKA